MTDQARHGGPFALVVDDDASLRMDVAEILEQAGFRTLEAGDGDEAILVLERRRLAVSLLFSDVEMPGSRDGLPLAREVAVEWPYMSIVAASGRIRPAPGELPAGARWRCKPFSPETVHGPLREMLFDDLKQPLRL